MRISPTALAGVFLIEPVPAHDERGLFARVFCTEIFAAHDLVDRFEQNSVSYNHRSGTLRGLHYQRTPHAETKLVRCTAGAIFDVAVDLRRHSPTFGRHVSQELSAENRAMLYIPEGFAHGFLTLADATEVFYEISPAFEQSAAAGIRFDDPDLAIPWPSAPALVGEKDRALPSFKEFVHDADQPVT